MNYHHNKQKVDVFSFQLAFLIIKSIATNWMLRSIHISIACYALNIVVVVGLDDNINLATLKLFIFYFSVMQLVKIQW